MTKLFDWIEYRLASQPIHKAVGVQPQPGRTERLPPAAAEVAREQKFARLTNLINVRRALARNN